jgi:hypothetical protein
MLVEAAHHDLVDINDRGPRATAHAAIIALLDRAIAACD